MNTVANKVLEPEFCREPGSGEPAIKIKIEQEEEEGQYVLVYLKKEGIRQINNLVSKYNHLFK